jgi:DNA repair photolyase
MKKRNSEAEKVPPLLGTKKIFLLENNKQFNIYGLDGFQPITMNRKYLEKIGVSVDIDPETLSGLEGGSINFQRLYAKKTLTPESVCDIGSVSVDEPLEIHNYTGLCPTNVFEITPSTGACSIACQYCLVTDGDHQEPTVVLKNYAEYVAGILERQKKIEAFYYFSPKTEAFSEPHLETGIAHEILRTFINHYEQHPDSKARMFIATKAGTRHMYFKHRGDSILDLLSRMEGRVQINGSIGIMPDKLRDILEPNAPSIEERLEALQLCQGRGLFAKSVLAQPLILPYMTEETLHDYFGKLQKANIENIKPEFLTVDIRNLVALAQFVHHFDPHLMKDLLSPYLSQDNQDHKKQRSRLAPDRQVSADMLNTLREYAEEYNLSISICNWVKSQMVPIDPSIKKIDTKSRNNGYRCLGYQTKLF